MAAALTIEQMILNHNIGVNLTDAYTLDGKTADEFAPAKHIHDASDIQTGVMDANRLPEAGQNSKGVVQLSNSTESNSEQNAATSFALNAVKRLAEGKADLKHDTLPGDVKAGEFKNVLTATATDESGKRQIRNVIISTSSPSNAVGKNGDLYFKYE